MVAGAGSFDARDFGQATDSAACALSFAIQSCGGTGKIKQVLHIPAAQDSVRKRSVEEIAGACCIHHADFIRRSIPEAMAVPGECAGFAERDADGAEMMLRLELRKGLQEVLYIRSVVRKLARRDGIVDEGEKAFELRSHVVKIGDNGNAGRASPGGCEAGRCGIVPINVKKAGGRDPDSLNEGRRDGEARVASPGDGSFAGRGVYKYKG